MAAKISTFWWFLPKKSSVSVKYAHFYHTTSTGVTNSAKTQGLLNPRWLPDSKWLPKSNLAAKIGTFWCFFPKK